MEIFKHITPSCEPLLYSESKQLLSLTLGVIILPNNAIIIFENYFFFFLKLTSLQHQHVYVLGECLLFN